MAAAEVSGLVALLLERRPNLTNDQVKWLLSRTARLAVDRRTGRASYSTWEQGFGRVDAAELFAYRKDVGSANLQDEYRARPENIGKRRALYRPDRL